MDSPNASLLVCIQGPYSRQPADYKVLGLPEVGGVVHLKLWLVLVHRSDSVQSKFDGGLVLFISTSSMTGLIDLARCSRGEGVDRACLLAYRWPEYEKDIAQSLLRHGAIQGMSRQLHAFAIRYLMRPV